MPALSNTPIDVSKLDLSTLEQKLRGVTGEGASSGRSAVQKALTGNNASVEEAAQVVASIMHSGYDETLKLKAATAVLEMHGAKDAEKVGTDLTLNFVFPNHGGQVNLQNILLPERFLTLADVADVTEHLS